MAKINSFTLENSKPIAKDLEVAVQAVAKKYGIEIKEYGFRYSSKETTFKLQAKVPGALAEDYRKHAAELGLPVDGLGKTFVDKHRTFTITGLDRYKSYPVTATRDDGEEYSFKVDYVIELLKAQPEAVTA
jgi:hypothetical protein